MSGKRRRSETSWDMKKDKIPPPESNDSWRPSWEGNRKEPRNDDISRDNKHRTFDDEWGKQHTTYRDRSRTPIQSRSRSRGREWESRRSPFYDDRHRHKSNDYGDHVRNNARGDNMKESWRHNRSDHLSGGGSRYSRLPHHKDDRNHDDDDDDDDRCRSNRVTKIQCKFFAVGKCYRDNCKFSHDASASHSQDYDQRSHDNIRAHMNSTWHHDHDHDQHPHASDLSEKKKSWGDVESGGFHENKKTTWEWDSHDKKKSWDDDDASNPNLDNKNRSWNGPSWDDDNHEKTKSKSWNGPSWDDSGLNKKVCEKNDYFLPKQHNVANDSHINNENIVSEEQPSKQILTSVEEQVENGKTPKKKQEVIGNLAENAQKEQEHINTEKVEKGSIGNDEKSTQQCREIDPNHVRSNSGGDNLKKESWSHRQDHSRSSSHNRNSRKHYDDGDDVKDDRCHQSNRVTNIQCKFFAAGNCKRDDCKFSHDVSDARNYDRRSHDNPRAHKKMTWHDDDLKASDLSEKHKSSWNGPTWDDVESGSFNEKNKKTTWDSHDFDDKKKSTTRDDMSNPNSDNKNKSWDDVESGGFNENKKTAWESQNCDDKRKSTKRDDMSNLNLDNKNMSWDEVDASKSNAKSGNNIDEKSKSWVKMDNNSNNKKMRNEKNDHFLPQQHNVVNDSHINNDNVVSEEEPNQQIVTTEQNLTNAIDYLKSLPNSTTHNQEGNNNVMEIENGKTPKKKQEETVGKGKGSENEKGKEGNNGNDEKCMRQFRAALVEFVKEILKPKWKEGRMTREVYKSVVKKVIDKITTTIQQVQIPKTQPKIELYLTHSKPKITKLVEAYVEKLVKA